MTEMQTVFAVALLVVVLVMSRMDTPDWRLPILFGVNHALSATNTGDMIPLGVIDLAAASAAIVFMTRQSIMIGVAYAVMGATYAAGSFWQWSDVATYGIVEGLCIVALIIMAGFDRDGSRMPLPNILGRFALRNDSRRGVAYLSGKGSVATTKKGVIK